MPGLSITISKRGEATILTLAGSASMHEIDHLSREVDRCAAAHPHRLVVDLSSLTFLASLAIGQILAMAHAVKLHGGTVVLAGPNPEVLGVLKRCNMPAVIPVAPNVEAALRE